MDRAVYKQFTTTAADMAKKIVEQQIEIFDMFATNAKGTPVAPFFDAAAKMQRATLEGFENLSASVADAPTNGAAKKAADAATKSMKATADAMKNAVNAQADMLVGVGVETVAASAKAKDAVKKATKSASKGDINALIGDLTTVTGIGPSTMKKLHASGIKTVEDLAKSSKKDLTAIVEEANIRMLKFTPADWIANAKSLVKTAKSA